MMMRCSLGPSGELAPAIVLIVVHVIVHPAVLAALAPHRILLVVLLHQLEVDLVVHLEAARLDLLLPHVIVDLHVVQDRVDEDANVRVLV
jgi:hypothetical protein